MNVDVSIIIPVYNDEDFIANCLDSILNQSLQNIEVICVDDGSSDNSLNILRNYEEKDSRVRVFTKENGGGGSARNLALPYARGEFVSFIDADDLVINNDVYRCLVLKSREYNVNMAAANLQFLMPSGILYETKDYNLVKTLELRKIEEYGIPWFFTRCIFKRNFIIENNIDFPLLKRGEDPVFLAKVLSKLDEYLQVPIPFYQYKSPTHNTLVSFVNFIDYIKSFYEIFKELIVQEKFHNIIVDFVDKMIQINNRDYFPINNQKELNALKEVTEDIKQLFLNYDSVLYKKISVAFDNLIRQIENELIIPISVIIPVYNGEKYLRQCMDSIVNQSLDNIEIICVNDGSTDSSLNILEEYALNDFRIKIISTDNYGLGSARNTGLKVAKGKYISFIDADDWIDKNSFELLYNYAINNDLDMLFFQMINYIENTGELIESDVYSHKCFIDKNYENTVFTYKDTLDHLFEIPVCAVSKIYKRDFLFDNNFLFPIGILFEDNEFFYNSLFKTEKLGFFREFLYYRRRHENSLTTNLNENIMDIVNAANLVLNVFQKYGLFREFKSQLINHTFEMIWSWLIKLPLEFKEDYFIKTKNEFLGFSKLKDDFYECLTDKYKNIFYLMDFSNFYFDFISKYELDGVQYSNLIWSKPTKNYKISVVIPVYNTGNILHRTMMSLENQTLGIDNIEVILIDDCSTDDLTIQIMDNYATKYDSVKSVHLKYNTGAAGIPRNVGIKEASADYIMFLDHDDFFECDALDKLYNIITNYDVDVVFGAYNSIDNGIPTDIIHVDEKEGYFESIVENERFIGVPPPSIWTKLFKKDLIIENNILFPPILGEDAIFMSKIFFHAKGIYFLKDYIVCYHDLRNTSTTNNVTLNYLIEGFISEKYMFNLFKYEGHENYFNYRISGLNFFLSQLVKANLRYVEFERLFPLVKWFVDKGNEVGFIPKNINIRFLFNSIAQNDLYASYEIARILNITNLNLLNKINSGEYSDDNLTEDLCHKSSLNNNLIISEDEFALKLNKLLNDAFNKNKLILEQNNKIEGLIRKINNLENELNNSSLEDKIFNKIFKKRIL